jgi:hypothetical protein
MLKMKKRCVQFVLFSFCSFILITEPVLANQNYLSKPFIDSLVQSAYYRFNAAEEYSDNHGMQDDAIQYARKVASYLKRKARKDLNQRYIIWKKNELEQQILLEEKDILHKKNYNQQLSLNSLVVQFNHEVGNERPDFAYLYMIQSSMAHINNDKARELNWLIEDRAMNISNELIYYLENALLDKQFTRADNEFDYLRRNRRYLAVNDSLYTRYSLCLEEKNDVEKVVIAMPARICKANRFISKRSIGKAWKILRSLRKNLKTIYPYTSPDTFKELKYSIKGSWRRIVQVEDSLVRENFRFIKARDSDAAVDYLESVLYKCGITKRKIKLVEKVILSIPTKETESVAKYVKNQLTPVKQEKEQDNGLSFSSMQNRVRVKLDCVHNSKKEKDQALLSKKLKANQAKANFFTRKLYCCLKNNEINKAYERFHKIRRPLKKYSTEEDFTKLEAAIIQSYELLSAKKKLSLSSSMP